MARGLVLEARATGYAGDPAAAEKIAGKSWEAYPTGEGARETAFWLSSLGRNAEAVELYADAFTVEDKATTQADRVRDRARLGELYAGLDRVGKKDWGYNPRRLRPHFGAAESAAREVSTQKTPIRRPC